MAEIDITKVQKQGKVSLKKPPYFFRTLLVYNRSGQMMLLSEQYPDRMTTLIKSLPV